MIRVRNAGYLYDGSDIHALEDISLVLEPGEHICVLGPNAGGKSTLAQLIAGVRFATAGEVVVDGTVLTPETAISVARNVGFVAQDPRSSMVSSLVFDEVAFGLRNLGLPSKKVAGRALGALERCGIRKLQHSSTTELSGGQQQLVSLAAALALDPAYLVLDEATAMLDGTSAKRIDALVDDLVADGVGVLEITHSILRAMGAHRIIVIDRGRMAWQGGFDALLSDDGALRVLGLDGDPTVALLRTIRAEGLSFASGCTPDDVRSYAEMHHLGYRLRSVVAPHRIAPGIAPAHELALDSVGVVYGKNVALSDLSVAIGDELVVVAGPSGSGKSTCAAVLTGILPPDEGDALLDGDRKSVV